MSDIDIFNKLITETAKVEVVDNYDKKKVILTEPQHPESSVTILGLPENVIVIKADAFKSPDSIFFDSMGECKRADFVIAAEANNKTVILCIEMKANKTKNKDTIIKQLKGAQCFVLYCREIIHKFRNERNFLKNPKFRFVCIGRTAMDKKKTRIERGAGVHDTPENMLKIYSSHNLQFKQLARAR